MKKHFNIMPVLVKMIAHVEPSVILTLDTHGLFSPHVSLYYSHSPGEEMELKNVE